MKAFRLALVTAAIAASGCGTDVDDRTIVDELRILGVKAEPPEAAPGESIALGALVADPLGGGRAVDFAWGTCAPDPVEGIAPCADPSGVAPLGVGTSLTLVVPESALDGLPPDEAARGVDVYVVLTVSAGEADAETAYKRVRISTSSTPNRNPELLALFSAEGGEELAADGERRRLFALLSEESAEAYVGALGEETREEMKFSWLSTDGAWDAALTFDDALPGVGENGWVAPEAAAEVWVIARDPRGGVDWIHRFASP